MKTFVKWLNIFFSFIEIISFGLICFGILFESLDLAGAHESFLVGWTFIAFIFLLKSLTPFEKRYNDTSPILSNTFALIVRRLLYFSMMVYAFAIVFSINELPGTNEMIFLSQITIIPIAIVIGILVAFNRASTKVFSDTLIRLTIILTLHGLILLTVHNPPVPYRVSQQNQKTV